MEKYLGYVWILEENTRYVSKPLNKIDSVGILAWYRTKQEY